MSKKEVNSIIFYSNKDDKKAFVIYEDETYNFIEMKEAEKDVVSLLNKNNFKNLKELTNKSIVKFMTQEEFNEYFENNYSNDLEINIRKILDISMKAIKDEDLELENDKLSKLVDDLISVTKDKNYELMTKYYVLLKEELKEISNNNKEEKKISIKNVSTPLKIGALALTIVLAGYVLKNISSHSNQHYITSNDVSSTSTDDNTSSNEIEQMEEEISEDNAEVEENDTNDDEMNDEIEIDDDIKKQIQKQLNYYDTITIDKLAELSSLNLKINQVPTELSFLNYCNNIEKLDISISEDINMNYSLFSDIDGYNFSGLKELIISDNNMNFNDDFNFISNIPSLEKLGIYSYREIDHNFLTSINNIKELYLPVYYNTYINYRDLDYLDTINFIDGTEPSNLAIYLNSDDIDYLNQNDTEIYINDSIYENFNDANYFLNKMLEEINAEGYSGLERINSVISYIMDNYKLSTGDPDDTTKYYKNGLLARTFKSKKIICGNYAALTAALLNRLDIETHIVSYDNNIVNLVKLPEEVKEEFNISDDYCYLDITKDDKKDNIYDNGYTWKFRDREEFTDYNDKTLRKTK